MGEVFGAKWVSQYGDADGPALKTWLQVLHGLSPDQIKQGFINVCRDRPKFLPDALQFREYCLSQAGFGLPHEKDAYLEAMRHSHEWQTWEWSHHAVYVALKLSNINLMRGLSEAESMPIYFRNYGVVCRKVMAGEPYEQPIPLAIPDRIPEFTSIEEGRERMKKIKSLVEGLA